MSDASPFVPPGRLLMVDIPGRTLDGDTAMALYPPYLDAVERLVVFLDTWTA